MEVMYHACYHCLFMFYPINSFTAMASVACSNFYSYDDIKFVYMVMPVHVIQAAHMFQNVEMLTSCFW